MPNRVAIDTGDIKRYDPLKKLFFGLNIKEADNDITEYLLSIGYEDPTYELGSRSKLPEEKRAENQYLSTVLPLVVEIAKEQSTSGPLRGETKREINQVARSIVKNTLATAKEEFLEDGYASPYATAVDDLSRIPRDDRKFAIVQFKKFNNGRSPDPTELTDLLQLIEFADIY